MQPPYGVVYLLRLIFDAKLIGLGSLLRLPMMSRSGAVPRQVQRPDQLGTVLAKRGPVGNVLEIREESKDLLDRSLNISYIVRPAVLGEGREPEGQGRDAASRLSRGKQVEVVRETFAVASVTDTLTKSDNK